MRRLLPILGFLLLLASPSWSAVVPVTAHCSIAKAQATSGGTITSASCTPQANDALIIQANCNTGTTTLPTAPTLTASPATGWSFTNLQDRKGTDASTGFGSVWVAIVPSATATTFTATWTTCAGGFSNIVMGEFSGNDTTGGATTFYASNFNSVTATTGPCSGAAVTVASTNDGLWGMCNDGLANTSFAGTSWTGLSADSSGDDCEGRSGVSGSQSPAWTSPPNSAFLQFAVAIKASGGAANLCTISLMGAGPC